MSKQEALMGERGGFIPDMVLDKVCPYAKDIAALQEVVGPALADVPLPPDASTWQLHTHASGSDNTGSELTYTVRILVPSGPLNMGQESRVNKGGLVVYGLHSVPESELHDPASDTEGIGDTELLQDTIEQYNGRLNGMKPGERFGALVLPLLEMGHVVTALDKLRSQFWMTHTYSNEMVRLPLAVVTGEGGQGELLLDTGKTPKEAVPKALDILGVPRPTM